MLSRSECFKALGLEDGAGPNAIKRAYRKLAFELHPDLNPDIPEAAKNFQHLNEAYVLLIKEYANTSFAPGSRQAGERGKPSEKTRAEAKKAYEKAGAGASEAEGPKTAGTYAGTHTPGREEILRDLLNDPFARRVFEDIYSHVRYNAGKGAKNAGKAPAPPRKPASAKITAIPARSSATAAVGRQFSRLADGIKGWLRKQIDEEQTMFMPGALLMPGSRIRLQVSHGFTGDKKTVVEVTLPPEFAPGRPIRLKGLGRRLGNLQGDLYLRIFVDEDDSE